MSRPRAWRRYKDYTKAKRKREIDLNDSWWDWSIYNNPIKPGYYSPNYKPKYGMYDNLHQYSKNKIHCSCPMCSAKTRNKGHRRKRKNYAPSINYSIMDLKKQQSMDADEKENNDMKYVRFYGGNGYCGCDYEYYESFGDDVSENEIETYATELGYENAEAYEYVVTGWNEDFETEDDRQEYYEDALSYCGWDYCTKEEFEENTKE